MSWADHPRTERDGDETGDVVGRSETEVLEQMRTESRAVLSEQITLLREIDDKAMRTVRTVVLVVSLLLSVSQLTDVRLVNRWSFRLVVVGVSFLVASLVTGVYTYSVSSIEFGVGDTHRAEVLAAPYTEQEWLRVQLAEYSRWTDSMATTNERNATLLQFVLVTTVIGVLSLLAAVAVTVSSRPETVLIPSCVALLATLGIYLSLWKQE